MNVIPADMLDGPRDVCRGLIRLNCLHTGTIKQVNSLYRAGLRGRVTTQASRPITSVISIDNNLPPNQVNTIYNFGAYCMRECHSLVTI